MTVTHSRDRLQRVPQRIAEAAVYTAAETLEVALAAYERGRVDALIDLRRDRLNDPDEIETFRRNRAAVEVVAAKAKAQSRYLAVGYPPGYDYKGGAVDWETGMPAGSGCAWLRHQRARAGYELAGGEQ